MPLVVAGCCFAAALDCELVGVEAVGWLRSQDDCCCVGSLRLVLLWLWTFGVEVVLRLRWLLV